MTNGRRLMDPLTRAEINEIERRKREENDARIKQLFGCVARHPRLNAQVIEARGDRAPVTPSTPIKLDT